jgi:hypothetical protein
MPLSDEQKQILRERLKGARQVKINKKAKVNELVKQVEILPVAPVITAAPTPVEPLPQVALQPHHSDAPIAVKVKRAARKIDVNEPVAQKEPKSAKPKYAKLVFYQEPSSNKKIKKLAKVLEQSSDDSDDTDSDFYPEQPKPQPTSESQLAQLRYNRISQLSRAFFD